LALNLDKVRVIVYDLDGTVYDDNRHFELYASEICSHLPEEVQADFRADYEATVNGRHGALRVGSFYDVQRDLVLYPKAGRIVRALHWDGSEVPPVVREQLYPGIVTTDNVTIMNVGDLWWVPSAISFHYGGEADNHTKSFLRVRDIMSEPTYTMTGIPGFKETVAALKASGKVVQVLATNSPQPDSESILTKIGLIGQFDRLYFRSGKPVGLQAIFAELAGQYGCGMEHILSVGDNLVNEIAPARAMGCQTVFIDPFNLGDEDDADLRVTSMEELIPALRTYAS
jgi:FMN phosphatase YigB (HAD superfamily)